MSACLTLPACDPDEPVANEVSSETAETQQEDAVVDLEELESHSHSHSPSGDPKLATANEPSCDDFFAETDELGPLLSADGWDASEATGVETALSEATLEYRVSSLGKSVDVVGELEMTDGTLQTWNVDLGAIALQDAAQGIFAIDLSALPPVSADATAGAIRLTLTASSEEADTGGTQVGISEPLYYRKSDDSIVILSQEQYREEIQGYAAEPNEIVVGVYDASAGVVSIPIDEYKESDDE